MPESWSCSSDASLSSNPASRNARRNATSTASPFGPRSSTDCLRAKHGWQKRALDVLNRRSSNGAWVAIEIVDP